MNIYDTANQLSKEIKESKEYQEFKNLKEEISTDLETKTKIEEFQKLRTEVQLLTIQGGEADKEKLAKLQGLYGILMQNEKVKNYFEAEMKFSVVLQDINKIIAETVKDVIS